uniref:F-box domain-containing protein n=1 Tax=Moniliophthora roreri TaxID=221103 RepID=A0A0W0F8F1_MONRR
MSPPKSRSRYMSTLFPSTNSTPLSLLLPKLPDEILSMIFSHATHTRDDPLSAVSTPLIISHVCTKWRKVALSAGSLWTKLAVFSPEIHASQLIRISTWLTRSKSYPLEVLLDFRYDEWDWDEYSHPFTGEMMKVVLELLLPHVGRWRTFEMLVDTWEPIHTFLVQTSGVKEVPMLQSVALSRINAYFVTKGQTFQPDDLKKPVPLFGGCALGSLRDAALSGVHVDWTTSYLRNLLNLSFKFHAADVMPSLKEFQNILAACPELQSLTVLGWGPRLDGDDDENDEDKASPVVASRIATLSCLARFSFGFVDVEYATDFLAMFRLPSLRELELQDISATLDPMGPLDAASILDWLVSHSIEESAKRSTCHYPLCRVEYLELEGLRSSGENFSRFLRAFTSLKKISLSNSDSELLAALHPVKEHAASLPGSVVVGGFRERRRSSFASTTLAQSCPELENMVCRRVDHKFLSEVVSARCQVGSGVRRLRKVEIDLQDSGEFEESSSFTLTKEDRSLLVESGVDLLVHRPASYRDDGE